MTEETKKKILAGITVTVGVVSLYFVWRQYSLAESQAQAAQNASDAAALQSFQDSQGQQGENLVGLGGGGIGGGTGATGATGSTLAETIASLDTALGLTPTIDPGPAPSTTPQAAAAAALTLQPTGSTATGTLQPSGFYSGEGPAHISRSPIKVVGVFSDPVADTPGNATAPAIIGPGD